MLGAESVLDWHGRGWVVLAALAKRPALILLSPVFPLALHRVLISPIKVFGLQLLLSPSLGQLNLRFLPQLALIDRLRRYVQAHSFRSISVLLLDCNLPREDIGLVGIGLPKLEFNLIPEILLCRLQCGVVFRGGAVVGDAEVEFLEGAFSFEWVLHFINKNYNNYKSYQPKMILDRPPGGLFTRTEVFYWFVGWYCPYCALEADYCRGRCCCTAISSYQWCCPYFCGGQGEQGVQAYWGRTEYPPCEFCCLPYPPFSLLSNPYPPFWPCRLRFWQYCSSASRILLGSSVGGQLGVCGSWYCLGFCQGCHCALYPGCTGCTGSVCCLQQFCCCWTGFCFSGHTVGVLSQARERELAPPGAQWTRVLRRLGLERQLALQQAIQLLQQQQYHRPSQSYSITSIRSSVYKALEIYTRISVYSSSQNTHRSQASIRSLASMRERRSSCTCLMYSQLMAFTMSSFSIIRPQQVVLSYTIFFLACSTWDCRADSLRLWWKTGARFQGKGRPY